MVEQESSKFDSETSNANWGPAAMEKLLHATLTEQKRKRRWGIFFKLAYLFVFLAVISMLSMDGTPGLEKKAHTALIDVKGVIMDGADSNADDLAAGLQAAFKNKHAKAIILRLNSPGGSPVQSGYVYDEIKRLRLQFPDKEVYAVCTDACASGAYYIASAADHIFAAPSSIVGSIGVYMGGFGFVDSIKKLGVERRLLTAGKDKGFLDPFSQIHPDQKLHAQQMLNQVHEQFIDAVVKGRGDRLKQDQELFTGLIWSGEEALKLGLVDGLGSPGFVARDVIKVPHIVDYSVKPDYFSRLTKMFTASFVDGLLTRVQHHQAALS